MYKITFGIMSTLDPVTVDDLSTLHVVAPVLIHGLDALGWDVYPVEINAVPWVRFLSDNRTEQGE